MERPTLKQIQEAGQQDYALREGLAETAKEKKRQAAAKIEEASQEIMGEIKELQLERGRVLTLPGEKGPFLKFVKEEFRRNRETFLSTPLREHLKGCQEVGETPFDPQRIHHNFPAGGSHLVWFVMTEEDIEKAVAGLDDGITEAERGKKIKEIDTKIAQLSKRLEDLA